MNGTENIALHTSMQSSALCIDLNPEMLVNSQYCEYRPRVMFTTVLTSRARERPLT